METTITICGWVLAGTIALVLAVFIAAALWGAAYLGYQLSTRFIRERRGWQKAIRESNNKITQYAAIIMSDSPEKRHSNRTAPQSRGDSKSTRRTLCMARTGGCRLRPLRA